MTEPLVSVKMLTYNHAPYIAKSIECTLAQKTNFPFELVIGEDFSTDGTREIVFDYAKRFPDIITVIISNENVGTKKNSIRTNNALNGKYIAWCEGDDYWHCDDKLQKQVDFLEEHSEYGLVCSDCDWHYRQSGITTPAHWKTWGKEIIISPDIIDIVTKKVDIRTCTVLARLNLVNDIQAADFHLHESGYFKMGDTQLWAEISLKSKIHYFDESLATYQT